MAAKLISEIPASRLAFRLVKSCSARNFKPLRNFAMLFQDRTPRLPFDTGNVDCLSGYGRVATKPRDVWGIYLTTNPQRKGLTTPHVSQGNYSNRCKVCPPAKGYLSYGISIARLGVSIRSWHLVRGAHDVRSSGHMVCGLPVGWEAPNPSALFLGTQPFSSLLLRAHYEYHPHKEHTMLWCSVAKRPRSPSPCSWRRQRVAAHLCQCSGRRHLSHLTREHTNSWAHPHSCI